MNYKNEEIDLRKLVINILLKWRIILIISAISVILSCTLVFYKGYEYEKSTAHISSDIQDYSIYNKDGAITDESIEEYLSKNDLSEEEVSDINNALNLVKGYKEVYSSNYDYLNNSELMKYDTIYVATIKLTVNSGDTKLRENILQSYKSLLNSDQFYEYISNKINFKADLKYINEMIKLSIVSNDTNTNSFLTVSLYNSVEEKSYIMADVVLEWLISNSDKVKENFGEHELIVIGQSISSEINSKYSDSKQNLYSALNSTSAKIKNIPNDLTDNERIYFTKIYNHIYNENEIETDKDGAEIIFTPYNYIKNYVKYGVIGFILGMMASGFLVYLIEIYKDMLQSDVDLANRFGLNVLGGVLCNTMNYKMNALDKALYKIRDKNNLFSSNNNNMDMLFISIKMIVNKYNYRNILLTGQMNKNVENSMIELKERLNQEGISVGIAQSIIENSKSLSMLENIDGVILVETIGQTYNDEIEKEIYTLKVQNVNIIGAIVVY